MKTKHSPKKSIGLAVAAGLGLLLLAWSIRAEAGGRAAADAAGLGFFAESYLEGDGIHSQGRRCPLDPDGSVDESDCVRFRVDIERAVDPYQAHAYRAYGAYLTYEEKPIIRQSLYDSGGEVSWYRSCEIEGGEVQWSKCDHRWRAFDLQSLGFGPIQAFGTFTYQSGLRTHLVQQIFGEDDRIRARSCPTDDGGRVDWNACANSWHEIDNVFGLSSDEFSDYGAYTFSQGDQAFLREVLIEANGYDEWSRVCELHEGKLRTPTVWGMMEVDPDYSLGIDCGDLWHHRDLRQMEWIPDEGGGSPESFIAYDAYYYNPVREAQRRIQRMVGRELEGFGSHAVGGLGGRVLIVDSTADSGQGSLRWALEEAADTEGGETILFAQGGVIRLESTLHVPDNTTIDAYGQNVTLTGHGLKLKGVRNVIISYISLRDGGDTDAIEITSENVCSDCRGAPVFSQDVWIHHVTLSNYGDGLLDICKGARDITVSWSHFQNHNKVMLIGCSNSSHHAAVDAGIRVTLHHNYFDGVTQRSPRVRQGLVDTYNNYYRDWGSYAIASSMHAQVRVENSVFDPARSTRAIICQVGDDPEVGSLQLTGNWLRNGAAVEGGCPFFDDQRAIPAGVQSADQRLITEIVSGAGDTR